MEFHWILSSFAPYIATLLSGGTADHPTCLIFGVHSTNALDNYEIMSKSATEIGNEKDGISPEAKKRMRELFALQMSGAMQKQNNPVHVEVVGDNHDILSFQWPAMSEEVSSEFLQASRDGDPNFWNGMRFMGYSQIVFSGDSYRRVINRQEIIANSKDYDEYKSRFLKGLKNLQAGAKGKITKP